MSSRATSVARDQTWGSSATSIGREQLVQSVLEPNATIHPDYGTMSPRRRMAKCIRASCATNQQGTAVARRGGQTRAAAIAEIDQERRTGTSLMPAGLHKTLKPEQFADLIAYLESLKQPEGESRFAGMPSEIPAVESPSDSCRCTRTTCGSTIPVWIIAIPGSRGAFLVVEQKARKIWRFEEDEPSRKRNCSPTSATKRRPVNSKGVVCVAFHPRFLENRKYYVNYHVRNQGSFFSPVIVERQATPDLRRDAGVPSRRLLQIPQDTDLHWGGMLAFGPDGYLYIGAGDAGPQEDPEGHGQDLSRLTGTILRIDVDRQEGGKPYAIPESNPYRNSAPRSVPRSGHPVFACRGASASIRSRTICGSATLARICSRKSRSPVAGENHGWNVYEGFMKFSDRYRREGETYTPPVMTYRRKYGVSVTGGYVYRGKRNASYDGTYIFGDFESKRIWALTQADRQLIKVRQIGESPQKIASFGVDSDGELLLVGYEGTIFRLVLDDSEFRCGSAMEGSREAASQQRAGGRSRQHRRQLTTSRTGRSTPRSARRSVTSLTSTRMIPSTWSCHRAACGWISAAASRRSPRRSPSMPKRPPS